MLLDIRYTDDGFIADALLTGPDERRLTDRDIARQVWRPEQILWIVPPVMARLRTQGLAQIPAEQKWSVVRRIGAVLLAEAMVCRLRARNGADHVRTLPDRSAWVHARVRFFENEAPSINAGALFFPPWPLPRRDFRVVRQNDSSAPSQ
jgi:hypothetical protein